MKRHFVVAGTLLWLTFLATPTIAAVSLSLSPKTAQVSPSGNLQFQVTVSGSTDSVVIWGVTGAGCVGITCGSITDDGLYTAPAKAPSPAAVTVTATSLADVTVSASASVSIGSAASVSVTVSPKDVVLATGGQQQFSANVTGTSNTAVTWSVSGIGCVAGSCGSITSTGLYTAPAAVPTSAAITIQAVSVADPTKSASASLVVQSATSVSVSISPKTAEVSAGGQQQFSAVVTGSTNTAVAWSVSGSGCSGAACGTISQGGLYSAPAALPNPPSITVKAKAVADPSASASATVSLVAGSAVSVSPSSATLKPGAQMQFTATNDGASTALVIWSISGSGCSGSSCGSISSTGLYTTPAAAPNPPIVAVTATLLSNPTKSGSATVTISSGTAVGVSIAPTSAQIGVGSSKQFTATVTGSSNTAVTWSIAGTGCAADTCGTISSSGLYTAPAVPPNPTFFSITATSVADTTKSASSSVTVVATVTITISPTLVKLVPSATGQFTAHVTGSSNTSVLWSVAGAGCFGVKCGTISSSGFYTAPATVPNPSVLTVSATAQADTTKSASAQVSIVSPVVVAISPTTVLVAVGAQQQFNAMITGSTNTAVNWSVSGTGCSGAGCGTISSSGLYTAPATLPSPPSLKVTATAQSDLSQSASAIVSLTPQNNSKLNGQYAFLFKGFDSAGVYDAAGFFIADGKGNITSGTEDINRTSGPHTGVAIFGTYQVNGDNRGTLTLKSGLGTFSFTFALNGTAKTASFIEGDSSGIHGSGVIKIQDPSAFDPSVFSGGYAIGLSGADAQGRVAAAGSIFPSGVGTISGSSLDVNDGGDLLPTFATFSGVYDIGMTGRGQATLVIPGFDQGTSNFALYAVSANQYFVVSTDPFIAGNPILAGSIEAQSGLPFRTSSFSGASVFGLTGSSGNSSQVTVGRMQFDGAGDIQVQFDQNSGGNISIGTVMTGAYSIQLNGRGVLTLDNLGSLPSTWIVYAIAPDRAFLLTSDGSVSNGDVYVQAIAPPFETGDMVGDFEFGSGEPSSWQANFATGALFFDGASKVSGTEDTSHAGTSTKNVAMSGTYAISMISNNGRGVILFSSPLATDALWVISGLEAIGLDVDPTNTSPTLIKFDQ